MRNIIYTICAVISIMLALPEIEGAYIWLFALMFGTFLMGHVVTDALNNPDD
jgi:hypothetical protein